jgi:FkbM family methyltransferase
LIVNRHEHPHTRVVGLSWRIHNARVRWLPAKVAAAARYGLLRALTRGRSIPVRLETGQRMLIDPTDVVQSHIGRFGNWEGDIYGAVRKLVRRNDTVLDLGGHVGYSTVLFADWVGPEGHVWCFEPLEGHRRKIGTNLSLNGFGPRVTVLDKAVAAEAGTVSFNPSGRLNAGTGSLASRRNSRSLTVQTVGLDEWMRANRIVDVAFCKMDIEGAETHALRGMSRAIESQAVQSMLIEFHPSMIDGFETWLNGATVTLARAGYTLMFWNGQQFTTEERRDADIYALALGDAARRRFFGDAIQ